MSDLEKIDIEKVNNFFMWLQGKNCPSEIHFKRKLRLTEKQAFDVIYYLQEHLRIMPDNYEMCKECKCIYDSYQEGSCISEDTLIIDDDDEVKANFPKKMHGTYCDDCRPD